jgi:cyclopropane fatty-acyl-phospholipid synthase-like methyltransferase
MSGSDRSIPSTVYSGEYFLTECEGYTEYEETQGLELTRRLRALWDFLYLDPDAQVLDIGSGRGEIIVHCARKGIRAVGLDYSSSALQLTRRTIRQAGGQERVGWRKPDLSQGNCRALPFCDGIFDRVILSDIVEHLYPKELEATVREVHRVLKPGGELVVHTMPNLWYYRYGYPVFRLVQRLRGYELPADPRERYRFSHVHVNEQTPRSLRKVLASVGFSDLRVWLYDYRDYAQYRPLMRRLMRLLTSLPLVRRIFCDDIFARAQR